VEEWNFESASKVEPLSHRVVLPSHTLAKVRACAPRVPITRVSDLAPLDRLRLPVFSATTPLAKDLTTHFGKGLDPEHAQLSAMMEAIERVSAESVDAAVRRVSFHEISDKGRAVDPRAFDLPNDSSFRPDRAIDWVEGFDLIRREPVWVPVDLVISPPEEGILRSVDSNGLASGNTLLEAAVHGLCEVIERDAFGLYSFCSRFADGGNGIAAPRRIAPESMPAESLAWTAPIAASGLRLQTDLLESDVGVPVFRSVLLDDDHPSRDGTRSRSFVGFGASPNATLAVMRSIAEAVQSRMGIIQGARDSYNSVVSASRPPAGQATWPLDGTLGHTRMADVGSFSTTDLLEDLHYLLERLQNAGFTRALVVNLTRRKFGIPVVRIRVPGMTSFAVNQRRVGWRCLRYLL
jgi:ribosomal protein S12 methylthiotransferase accessory factor